MKESIFTRVYHLSGVIGVDEPAGVAKCTVFFRRTSREPLLKVIANNALGFIPGAPRLGYAWESLKPSVAEGTLYVEISAEPTGAMQDENTLFRILEKVRSDHNLFYLRQFPPAIRRFERLLVTLKAVAAAVRFFRGLQAGGIPVTFPTVVDPPSNVPAHIHGLVPPELAVLSGHTCVPSDVEFSLGNPPSSSPAPTTTARPPTWTPSASPRRSSRPASPSSRPKPPSSPATRSSPTSFAPATFGPANPPSPTSAPARSVSSSNSPIAAWPSATSSSAAPRPRTA